MQYLNCSAKFILVFIYLQQLKLGVQFTKNCTCAMTSAMTSAMMPPVLCKLYTYVTAMLILTSLYTLRTSPVQYPWSNNKGRKEGSSTRRRSFLPCWWDHVFHCCRPGIAQCDVLRQGLLHVYRTRKRKNAGPTISLVRVGKCSLYVKWRFFSWLSSPCCFLQRSSQAYKWLCICVMWKSEWRRGDFLVPTTIFRLYG